jgi:zinc-binding alcohol dehydrogenase family protein
VPLEIGVEMKAVGYRKSLPIADAESLLDIEVATPEPGAHDLLVEVKAVSVNPVDTKVRMRQSAEKDGYKILGYDAAGVVRKVGSTCTLFKEGDEVFYAGSIGRQGTNSQFHLVDERITGKKPQSLSFGNAAAMPLTSITAWELLFDRFCVQPGKPHDAGTLLIVGGAGGVGSILIQLARRLTGLTVVATASRPDTQEWCKSLGAHHVIDHSKSLTEEFRSTGLKQATYIASLVGTQTHYENLVELLAPQGKFGVIDDPKSIDVKLLKTKCASLHWEFMFARSMFETSDMLGQHLLLNEMADLVDAGIIKNTTDASLGTINAENLKKAHALLESGKAKGKLVLEGF